MRKMKPSRDKYFKTAPSVIEDSLARSGLRPVAGVDEAGRGALAGPVVACAVILPQGLVINGVNDSKKLSAKLRKELEHEIKKAAVSYAYGIIEAAKIDEINILNAALLAMKQAIESLSTPPQAVLADGTYSPSCEAKVICVKQGDSESHLIAAASILAKVYRDDIMTGIHEAYPVYGFASHKGYGTALHREAIMRHGLSAEHRKSFRHYAL